MQEMRITLYGEPRTKKNRQQPVLTKRKDGSTYLRLIPSKPYEQYEADCLRQITGDKRLCIHHPVNLKAVYYMKTHRIVDLVNLLEATCDILVAANVLKDDNSRIVVSHDGSRVMYDKTNPRAEIIIEDSKEDYQLSFLDHVNSEHPAEMGNGGTRE